MSICLKAPATPSAPSLQQTHMDMTLDLSLDFLKMVLDDKTRRKGALSKPQGKISKPKKSVRFVV